MTINPFPKTMGLASHTTAALLVSIGYFDMAEAVPIRTLPGLDSITFFEGTSGVIEIQETQVTASSGTPLTVRLPDPLSINDPANPNDDNCDFATAASECYDYFYSDAHGTLDVDGWFITVEATFNPEEFPTGNSGGLNLIEIQLMFTNGDPVFGDTVPSFVSGPGYVLDSELNAADGSTLSASFMGATNFGGPDRLRVTVGFDSLKVVPEPTTFALVGIGLAGIAGLRRRRKR